MMKSGYYLAITDGSEIYHCWIIDFKYHDLIRLWLMIVKFIIAEPVTSNHMMEQGCYSSMTDIAIIIFIKAVTMHITN